jgi:Holliday junction resolvase
MSEQKHQNKLIQQLEKDGYYVIKLITTNRHGIPDLLALKPNEVRLIEVKAKKGKLSELQKFRIKELQQLGFKTEVSYGPN